PPTIKDAMTVTLRHCFQFLWIDRYCINQSSAMDMHLRIIQMGQIYASANLTIIALVGTDPTSGLPGIGHPRKTIKARKEQVGPVTLVQLNTEVAKNLQQLTWATRAWTFKEGILSKRRLVFTHQAILYIC
ncbi:hypothetical protein BU23DRAFT_441407, partial [Bimuria novae-zelandiae CBS 107.79]